MNSNLEHIYNDRRFFGHPIGLAILFFTEMWERFSYYGMRALLVLYISSTIEKGGLGWTNSEALGLYGWYTMLVYLMSVPGGIIADKVLGQKRTVMLGGLLLCAGHLVLAFEGIGAFYTGLALIVFGVGGLKPNISTMVGGLYKQGDIRRDKGFTIFYIGINVGAFLAGIIVGTIGQSEEWGWHYGFGLAGIGMVLGQIVFIWGQKYLKGVGDLLLETTNKDATKNLEMPNHFTRFFKNPLSLVFTLILIVIGIYVTLEESIGWGLILLTVAPFLGLGINIYKFELSKLERDRVFVLLISFLIIIVFWGAFEQAGGLMNIYADEKIDRNVFGIFEIPASVFQSVNAFFIMIFGALVASFWAIRKTKGKESSSIFKMAIGTIIMGTGFLMMTGASMEASSEIFGKGAMYWLILAYLLHTLGELSASPVSLSFITKLAPVQYVSIMMGLYFAATGFGNKLAGIIGESSQIEPIEVTFNANKDALKGEEAFENIKEDKDFGFKTTLYLEAEDLVIYKYEDEKLNLSSILEFEDEKLSLLKETLKNEGASKEKPLHARINFSKNTEAKKVVANKGDGKNYGGTVLIEEVQNALELRTFLIIFGFTVVFGLLLIIFLKKLKALTHGADDDKIEA